MVGLHPILAAGENITEILFGVVFFLIWIASAAMSQMAKQRDQQRREQVRREIESGRTAPPAMPLQIQQRRPIQRATAPRPAAPRPPARRPTQAPKHPAPRRASVPIEAMMQATPATPSIPNEAKPRPAAAPIRQPLSANAATLRAWLRPATLKQQFILTEVLQPPLALRDEPLR
jgi:hypothetical protein